jgi:hypothetical protein
MFRTLVFSLLVFSSALPAIAKPHDVYPVSCDVVWSAVKTVLQNPNDYHIAGLSDSMYKASFLVIGDLKPLMNNVVLTDMGPSCGMDVTMVQVGSDNSNERAFRKHLSKVMAKQQAAKPAKPATPATPTGGE